MELEGAEARRQEVLQASRTAGSAATQRLIAALDDEDAIVREWAIESLARRRDRSEALAGLVDRLQDTRSDVRWYAARALGKLGIVEPPMREALIRALDDPDEYVRCFAAWAIGALRLKHATAELRRRLKAAPRRGLEEQCLGVALARLGTETPHQPVQESLFTEDQLPPPPPPSTLPKTKAEMLQEELARTAEQVAFDRAGGTLLVKAGIRNVVRYARSEPLKQRVLAERGALCQLCGFTFRTASGEDFAECHHVTPVSIGGADEPDNLLVLARTIIGSSTTRRSSSRPGVRAPRRSRSTAS